MRPPKRRIEGISAAVVEYLESGEYPPSRREGGDGAAFWEVFSKTGLDGAELRDDWEAVREAVLAEWIELHPGTRPWAWWVYDAPAWSGPIPEAWRGGYWVAGLKD